MGIDIKVTNNEDFDILRFFSKNKEVVNFVSYLYDKEIENSREIMPALNISKSSYLELCCSLANFGLISFQQDSKFLFSEIYLTSKGKKYLQKIN